MEGTTIKIKSGNECTIFKCPSLTRCPMKFFGTKDYHDPLIVLDKKISTVNSFEMPCAICGTSENIEMHHLKHIKTINLKLSEFDKKVARVNRKQIPLCTTCHREVHRGEYKGKSLKWLK